LDRSFEEGDIVLYNNNSNEYFLMIYDDEGIENFIIDNPFTFISKIKPTIQKALIFTVILLLIPIVFLVVKNLIFIQG
jgi:hypothetical protein